MPVAATEVLSYSKARGSRQIFPGQLSFKRNILPGTSRQGFKTDLPGRIDSGWDSFSHSIKEFMYLEGSRFQSSHINR